MRMLVMSGMGAYMGGGVLCVKLDNNNTEEGTDKEMFLVVRNFTQGAYDLNSCNLQEFE